MGRAPCCDKVKVKKGPWSVEEDNVLKNFITRFGNGGNWISLPTKAGLNRCGKSCRLRWLNYLRPDIKHGDFTEEEDYMIYTLYQTIGSRWSVIASNLPGRTDNDVKNHWNTKLKKKILAGKIKNYNIVPSTSNINHPSIESNVSYCQNLGTENMGLDLDQSHEVVVHPGHSENFTMVDNDDKYAESTSVSQEMCSHSGSSSSMDSNPSNSSSVSISSTTGKEDEFWEDLSLETFDDIVASSLLEEKIREIASLLDVSVD